MDNFYNECLEKIQNEDDPAAAIDALTAISVHDLPKVQLCKFSEQVVTLLSIIFQATSGSQKNLTIKFQQIRQQRNVVLSFMNRIMDAEKEFPLQQPDDDGCWW